MYMAKRGRKFQTLTILTKSLTDEAKRLRGLERTLNEDSKKMKLILGDNMPKSRADREWLQKTGMHTIDHPYWKMKKHSEMFNNLRNTTLRDDARSSFLALAFLLGKPYETVENKRKDSVGFERYILPNVVQKVFDIKVVENIENSNLDDDLPALFDAIEKDVYVWCGIAHGIS